MTIIEFGTGQRVEFSGNPTQADVEEVARQLGIGGQPSAQPAQATQPAQKGILRSMVEDPLKTLLVQPAARTAEALGRIGLFGSNIARGYEEMAGQPQTFGGITVEPQKAFGEGGARQITGDIAKTTSYLYTGGQVPTIAGQSLKGQILQSAATSAKAGAISGGAYSFGEAIQQAETQPADIAYQTLFGTALGGVSGGVLGGAVPVAVRAGGAVKRLTNLAEVENSLVQANKEILKPTATQMADWTEAKVDPLKTFVREFGPESIPTSNNTLQLDDFIEKVDTKYRAGAEGFNTILRNSPETVSLSAQQADVLSNINKSNLTATQKQNALNKARAEFDAILQEARATGNLLGEDNVTVAYADNLKDRYWGATKNFGSEESTVANAVNKNYGFAFQNAIENAVPDVNVKQYNKQLQELIILKDFLESRNGKVPGSGGKMARYTARIVGGIAGSGGGPIGTAGGAITADQLAQAAIRPDVRTWILRKQLQKLAPEVRQSLEQQANDIVAQMMQKRAETLKLPAPSMPTVPQTIQLPGENILRGQQNIRNLAP